MLVSFHVLYLVSFSWTDGMNYLGSILVLILIYEPGGIVFAGSRVIPIIFYLGTDI
jgi:hypothetical protein